MRTPLGNLMGQTQQLLHRARSVEDYRALLVSNQEEYERLARMIDNMLFLARAEQPAAAIERSALHCRHWSSNCATTSKASPRSAASSCSTRPRASCAATPN